VLFLSFVVKKPDTNGSGQANACTVEQNERLHHEEHEGTRRMDFDELSNRVIGCAIEVHRELGPGLLESTYEQCLAHELKLNGISFHLQSPQPVAYKGIRLDCGYRVDVLVEEALILELKSVEAIKGIHEAQLLTYMKLAGVKTGLLINFNVTKLKTGIKRFVL
jgi:GxxExxY protein